MEKSLTNLLSICIPTYNRKPFLEWALARAAKDFPDSKFVISDNCSNDDTINFQCPEGINPQYIRQATNIGAFPNMRAALLAARTKYCVFLGDEDYMLPDRVEAGIEFLEKHPDVNVYYAPCQLYDEVEHKAAWDAFYVATDTTYSKPDELWNFVTANHVWPEHAIYRRPKLDAIMQERARPYWCFVDLGNAAKVGPVHFASIPYYRNITQHPVGYRQKLGDVQCLTDFEEYRSGLEVMAFDFFQDHLHDGVPEKYRTELKVTINNGIRQFIFARLQVARRILLAQNRHAEAETFMKRMLITGY